MFYDCLAHDQTTDTELIVVEGLSAAANVKRARNAKTQAVLALQGKPVNAAKSSAARVQQDPQLSLLRSSLCGVNTADTEGRSYRYKRLVLLFDPDADGIHCAALLQIYLHKHLPQFIASQRAVLVRAPSHEIHVSGHAEAIYAYSDPHFQKLQQHLNSQGYNIRKSTRFKGVASLQVPLLQRSCLHQETRKEHALSLKDTQAAVQAFAGKMHKKGPT